MIQNTNSEYHYNVIARAIKIIDAADSELSLESLSERMGMSSSHFQRLFSRWVGVSPKRYQQYLTLGHARQLLQNRSTIFETSLALGLSSQGRLHDLFVRWESMSPGEFAQGGEGLQIRWGWFDSPFAPMLVMGTQRGICGMAFALAQGKQYALTDLCKRWPKAQFIHDPAAVNDSVQSLLNQKGEISLHLMGRPFHIKVWEALLSVPQGYVTTYSQLAQHIGVPKAQRAVGTAVGRNPICWLIPCHRVLRKSGQLGGYHWGIGIKRSMLGWESARFDSGEVQTEEVVD